MPPEARNIDSVTRFDFCQRSYGQGILNLRIPGYVGFVQINHAHMRAPGRQQERAGIQVGYLFRRKERKSSAAGNRTSDILARIIMRRSYGLVA
jgi:hypothetical protein